MPLSTRNFTRLEGLATEASEVDPALRPPNSLLDCRNVAFPKEGALTARKGFPVALDAASIYGGTIGSYVAAMQEVDSGNIQVIWGNTASGVSTSLWGGVNNAYITNSSTVNYVADPLFYTRTGGAASGVKILQPYVAANVPAWLSSQGVWYYTTDNGLFRATGSSSNGLFHKVYNSYS